MKLLLQTRQVSPSFSASFSSFTAPERHGTDGEAGRGDDENVKSETFTHLLLYCLSLQEWGGEQTGG